MKLVLYILACISALVTFASQYYVMQLSLLMTDYERYIELVFINSAGMTFVVLFLSIASLVNEHSLAIKIAGSTFAVLSAAQLAGLISGYEFSKLYIYINFGIVGMIAVYLNRKLRE